MTDVKSFATAVARAAAMASALSVSQVWAAPTSLEVYGVLFDGVGNRINAPFVLASSALYGSATGGSLLAQFAAEAVQVGNGSFLQVFSVDDTLFSGDAYLQLDINGFTLAPRLAVLYNGAYHFANGVTAGLAGATAFQLYAGLAAPVPEASAATMLAAGLAAIALLCRWRRPR